MTYDPMEWTIRDPLEETVPDPVERRPRLSAAHRRALEVAALVLLVPGFLTVQWIDNAHLSLNAGTNEHVTVVPRGGTGALGHLRLRMLGRDSAPPAQDGSLPAGSVQLKLVMAAQPVDAQGAKDVNLVQYTVRDRAGHVWSAAGATDRAQKPAAGATSQVTVTATVPKSLVSSVVLEVRPGGFAKKSPVPTPVLRFAH